MFFLVLFKKKILMCDMDFTRTKTCFQLECFPFFICENVGKIISVPIRNCVNVQNSSSWLWKNKESKRKEMKEILNPLLLWFPWNMKREEKKWRNLTQVLFKCYLSKRGNQVQMQSSWLSWVLHFIWDKVVGNTYLFI